jgi:hypothetical protein
MTEQHQPKDEVHEPDFARYEANKAAFVRAKPDATQAEYDAAMLVNARVCGC